MAAVQPIPDDEIAAELAATWDPDDGPAPVAVPEPRPGPWRPTGPQDLAQVIQRTRPVSLRHEQGLPVVGALAELLPAGLPRGAVVSAGGTSLALALAAAPVAVGSWVAVVGLPAVGLAAAAELGVGLERVVVVQAPPADRWATAVGALVGAFDLVLVAPPPRVRAAEGRRLAARARERGSVLITLGVGSGPGAVPADPLLSPTLRLRVADQRWFGVGDGHGHLQRRWARVELDGRGPAARARRVDLWLPDETGAVRAVRLDERVESLPVTAGASGVFGEVGIGVSSGIGVFGEAGGGASGVSGAEPSPPSVGRLQDRAAPLHEVRRQRIRRVARRALTDPARADGR